VDGGRPPEAANGATRGGERGRVVGAGGGSDERASAQTPGTAEGARGADDARTPGAAETGAPRCFTTGRIAPRRFTT
jgi:hypothetical protein